MSDKLGLGLGSEVRPLRLGSSFTGKNNPFHTIRYDFKPASVDTSKMACVEVANNNQVTVTVPHCDGAGTASTVFKGPQKPYNRECVLIIDNETGQITLEKLSQNLMLKKTRAEGSSRMSALVPEDPPPPPSSSSSSHSRAPIPSSSSSFHPPSSSSSSHSYSQPHSKKPSPGRKSAHMKRSVSPLTKSPPAPPQVSKPTPAPAPPSSYAPPQALPSGPKLPGSMPFLGLDMEDDSDGDQSNSPFHMPSAFSATPSSVPAATSASSAASTTAIRDVPEVGVLSDSSDSGSGSDSSSSSDSDSDSDIEKRSVPRHNGSNGGLNRAVMERAEPPPAVAPTFSMPSHLLSEDLQLSDSGSDSD